jgi:hypothetical protein
MTKFVLARNPSIDADGGIYTLDTTLSLTVKYQIQEVYISVDKDDVVFEMLYTEDGGLTWINPWDSGSNFILKGYPAKGVVFQGEVHTVEFTGGTNRKIQVKITNNGTEEAHPVFIISGVAIV